MTGEFILIADSGAGVQDIFQSALEDAGYNVVQASNGAAALTHPDVEKMDLLVLDKDMAGFDGLQTTRMLHADSGTCRIPVLLLVSETPDEGSPPLAGAAGYLVKPFTPKRLVNQVQTLLEERELKRQSEERLREAANRWMEGTAEAQVQGAVERKTTLIVERLIQNVVTRIEQQAQGEVNSRITALSEEKEAELVKKTVEEVAHSMIDKMAEAKVKEAIEKALAEAAEKTVRRVGEEMLPKLMRDRLKEMIDYTAPREITRRVQAAVESKTQEFSNQIIETINALSHQTVPKIAHERLPDIVNRQVEASCEQQIPKLVKGWVTQEIQEQLGKKIEPVIESASTAIRRKIVTLLGIMLGINVIAIIALAIFFVLKTLR